MGSLDNMKIILTGRIPSKKNSRQWIKRGGRMLLVPSKDYAMWHEEKMWDLIKYRNRLKEPIKRCSIDIQIFFPDNIRADISNKVESIMDLLVDSKILEDDRWQVCYKLNLEALGIDKKDPRAIILIEYENINTPASKAGAKSRDK